MALVGGMMQGSGQATTAPPGKAAIPALPATPGAATAQNPGAVVVTDVRTPGVIPGQDPSVTYSSTQPPDLPLDVARVVQEAVPIFGIVLSMCFVIFVGWPLARALARRMDRRTETGGLTAADIAPQIRQLQESVDAMAVELERISEAQRYQARLMTERQPAVLPAREGPRA